MSFDATPVSQLIWAERNKHVSAKAQRILQDQQDELDRLEALAIQEDADVLRKARAA